MTTQAPQVRRVAPGHEPTLRDRLQDVVDRLRLEYDGELPAGSVIRCVARCTEIVSRSDVPRACMPEAVEDMARAALNGRIGIDAPLTPLDVVDLRDRVPRVGRA